MHTTKLSKGWTAIHNGDFSGAVELIDPNGKLVATLPMHVLKSVVAAYIRGYRTAKLEQADTDTLLRVGSF